MRETRIPALWGHWLDGKTISGNQGRLLLAPGSEAVRFTLQALRVREEAQASRTPQEKFSPLFCTQNSKCLPALGILVALLSSWQLSQRGLSEGEVGRGAKDSFHSGGLPAGTSQPNCPFPRKSLGIAVAWRAPIWL